MSNAVYESGLSEAVKTLSEKITTDDDWATFAVLWQEMHDPYVKENKEHCKELMLFVLDEIRTAKDDQKSNMSDALLRRYALHVWFKMTKAKLTIEKISKMDADDPETETYIQSFFKVESVRSVRSVRSKTPVQPGSVDELTTHMNQIDL